MFLKSLTPAVRDLRRIHAALVFPDVLIGVLGLISILCFFLGRPFLWLLAISTLGIVLTCSMRRRSVAATVILAIILSVAWFWGIAGGAAGRWTSALGALLMLIPLGLCWRAIPSAIRLRRAFGKPYQTRSTWRWRVPRDGRALKLILPATLFLMYFSLGAIAFCFGALIGKGTGAGFAFRPFARRGNTRYRQVLQVLSYRAQEIRAIDRRPPVLFLHSFIDDDLTLSRQYGLITRVLQVILTLEELIVDRIWSLGPVVAIGKPKEGMSPIGAAREYIDDSLWQPRATALLEQSVAVVSVLGETSGLLWEYRRVAEMRKPLLIVVPHAEPAVLIGRWRAFCQVFPPAAAISVPGDGNGDFPLLAWFPPIEIEEPIVLVCCHQNEGSYRLAFDDLFRRIGPDTIRV